MKKFLFIGFALTLISNAMAQTITVCDNETHLPLEGVTLVSKNPNAFATTDSRGNAGVASFKGSDKIEVRCLGYKTKLISYPAIEESGFNINLILTGVPLGEVVISASKFEEQQDDVAQHIQVMRKSELQQMNQTSMADVVSASGNIMVQKSQLGGGSPIIRGFETNKILIVVDGVRMNNAIYRAGHLQNVITLDNAEMERVELVYGAGSVVYGSDALGGVMHFYTKNPVLSNGDSTIVKSGAFTRFSSAVSGFAMHADVSMGNQNFGSLTSITYSAFGDLRQGARRNPFYGNFGSRPWYVDQINGVDSMVMNSDTNVQVGSGYSQYDILQKFLFKPSHGVTHVVNFQLSNSSDIPRYDRLTQLSGGNPKFGEWYYGPQKRLFVSYSLWLDNPVGFYDHARIIAGFQNIVESRNTRRFRSDNLGHKIEQVDVLSLNADFDKVTGKQELRYGAEAVYNKVNSTANTENIITGASEPTETRYPDGGSTMNSFALYGTHTWEINDKLILNDGLRLNNVGLKSRFNDKSFFPFPFNEVSQNNTALNGNLGLIVKPLEGWRFTLQFATGFRAPNVDDIGKVFESVPGSIIVPNPDLKPEYTYNGEVGLSKTFNKQIVASVAGYYTLLKNTLTVQPTLYEGQDSIMYNGEMSRVTCTVNAGEAYIYGVEGRLAGNLNEYLSVIGTVNYTYGRIKTDTTGYPLDHIPPVFGKVSFKAHKNNLCGEFVVNYSGWKRLEDYNVFGEDNINYATEYGMPAWYTLNIRLGYQLSKSLNLQIACENMLDQNYRVFASNISAPGRNFIVTLRGNF